MAGTADDRRWARCQSRFCCCCCHPAELRGEPARLSEVPRLTEDSTGSIVTGEAGLAHARTNRQSVLLIILDFVFFGRGGEDIAGGPSSHQLWRAFGGGSAHESAVSEGKGSVAGLPIVDNESSDFLCTAKTQSASRRRRENKRMRMMPVAARAAAARPGGSARAAGGRRVGSFLGARSQRTLHFD